MEVRPHPVAQVDGLPDVNDRTFGVAVDVTAWFERQGGENALNVFRNFYHIGLILSRRVKITFPSTNPISITDVSIHHPCISFSSMAHVGWALAHRQRIPPRLRGG